MGAWGRTRRVAALAALACAPAHGAAPAVAAPGPALTVDAAADRAPISADIYGANLAEEVSPARPLAGELGLTVDRWGGNLFEGYNWQLGAVNTAADYFFENIADCFYFGTAGCAGGNSPEYVRFVDRVRARGGRPLIQLPMAGYVAKDAPTVHPFTCGFPNPPNAAQQSFDPNDPACGNGLMPDGITPIPSTPTNSGVAQNQTFAAAWVADLVARYGRADQGGVPLYSLGNEPGLWPTTHRHVHPAATTYQELADKTIAYAGAVRDADPSAKILAFSEWGWISYFCSALDDPFTFGCGPTAGADRPDRAAHGGKPLVTWLLEQVRVAGQAQGRQLIDYVDVHYYRQVGETTTNATRSLWDPTYTDPSYIADVIRLIPRMEEWVAQELPGIGTALSEYNLSVPGQPVDNVLIQADALGIFGREGLDLATRFDVADDGTPDETRRIYDAFRIYRNYDGQGGRFGDTRVRAASADQGALAVYGAQRSADGALTLVLVNKSATELTSPLSVSGFTAAGPAKAYQWTAATTGVVPAPDVALGGSVTVPAKSITLLVAPQAAAPGAGPGTGPGGGTVVTPISKPAAKRCKVPSVVGRKLADAKRLLKRRGCKTGKVSRVASKRRKGRVVRQSVKPGRFVKAGTKVALRVSKGRRR